MERKKRSIKETSSLSQSRQGPKTCYGATRNPELNKADYKLVAHQLTSSDTLQGLAIKYGVTVEQIRRVNKLWTNDNIVIYKTLNIPVKEKTSHEEDTWGDKVTPGDITIDVECGSSTMVSSSASETNSKNTDSLSKFLNKLDDQMKSSIQQAKEQRTSSGPALINNLETNLEKEFLKRRKMSDTNTKQSTTQVSLMSKQSRRTSHNSNEMSSLSDLYEL